MNPFHYLYAIQFLCSSNIRTPRGNLKMGMNSIAFLLLVSIFSLSSSATRNLLRLYQPPAIGVSYHNGPLLDGQVRVSVLWYGKFKPNQKSIVVDFLQSINGDSGPNFQEPPTVSQWWRTIQSYFQKLGKKEPQLILSNQFTDEKCSIGKKLKKSEVSELARLVNSGSGGLVLVLTAVDVTVEGFCMSNCGYHGRIDGKTVYAWVGNSAVQCPGQCAWPFHQPVYGPQTPPLGAPNGEVGLDGMIVNIASVLAGAVTNPFGSGYFQGPVEAPLEAASACPGVYGKGAYPGYAGELRVDPASGGSYNAVGMRGRKYLLPAVFDPRTSQCRTMV